MHIRLAVLHVNEKLGSQDSWQVKLNLLLVRGLLFFNLGLGSV